MVWGIRRNSREENLDQDGGWNEQFIVNGRQGRKMVMAEFQTMNWSKTGPSQNKKAL